jgi:hypothetical protein
MPFGIKKLPNQNKYEVYNELTGMKHSKGTTLEKAKKQIRLLNAIHNKDFIKKNKLVFA